MIKSEWWSQEVAAEGSIASEGIRRQLGRPELDPLTVLVRETAQNTCDAALPGSDDVRFDLHLRRLSGNRLINWASFLGAGPAGAELGLESLFGGQLVDGVQILTIADRGTTGLGGPLLANEPARDGERPDFVNFVRNVGERKQMEHSGGSYGFGKGILYNVSRRHVIVVDSVCDFRGHRQRRLIGAALGDGFEAGERRYTGRHWLGEIRGEIAQPLLDADADDMAIRLGLPSFAAHETGTTIAIVDVDLGRRVADPAAGSEDSAAELERPRTPEQAAEFLASTIAWNLWPRMLSGRSNRLRCTVKLDGDPREVPDPEREPDLIPFVEAYRMLGLGEVPQRSSPPREIGRFAKVERPAPRRRSDLILAAAPFRERAHHCARMRQADLIVDYLAGDPILDEMVQYGAVFRASEEADGFFAESEPPTHDAWVASGLKGTAKGVVQLADRFIRSKLRPEIAPMTVVDSSGARLVGFANQLGALLAGVPGDTAGASDPSPDGGGGGGIGSRRSTQPRFVSGPGLAVIDGAVRLVGEIELPQWSGPTTVAARPVAVVEGGTEADAPGLPRTLSWVAIETGRIVNGVLSVDRGDERSWRLIMSQPEDVAVRIELTVDRES